MVTVFRTGKLKISIYADHAPPHFHVRTPEGDSVVDLMSLVEVAGNANRKVLNQAIAWAFQEENRRLLEETWRRLNGA